MDDNSDSDSDSDSDNGVPTESVDCQPLETSSHDTSEEAEESQAPPDQLEQSDDETQPPNHRS